ncbi:hypothetical protein HYE68_010501 [Fusarium pseudograminearum]|nr:hypothetical protein HYE68_010501 [Fusarium pseudograminearum]
MDACMHDLPILVKSCRVLKLSSQTNNILMTVGSPLIGKELPGTYIQLPTSRTPLTTYLHWLDFVDVAQQGELG